MKLNTNGVTEFNDLIIFAGNDVNEETDTPITDKFMFAVERVGDNGSQVLKVKCDIESHETMLKELCEFLKTVDAIH